jgi:hypothetical protein
MGKHHGQRAKARTCVATMTNLPARFAALINIFCASATFATGISIPKSPRATMTPTPAGHLKGHCCIDNHHNEM